MTRQDVKDFLRSDMVFDIPASIANILFSITNRHSCQVMFPEDWAMSLLEDFEEADMFNIQVLKDKVGQITVEHLDFLIECVLAYEETEVVATIMEIKNRFYSNCNDRYIDDL